MMGQLIYKTVKRSLPEKQKKKKKKKVNFQDNINLNIIFSLFPCTCTEKMDIVIGPELVKCLPNHDTWNIGYRNAAYMVLLPSLELIIRLCGNPYIHHYDHTDARACLWCALREFSFAYWKMPLTAVELQEYSDRIWHRWAAHCRVQQDSAEHLLSVVKALCDCE